MRETFNLLSIVIFSDNDFQMDLVGEPDDT